MQCCNPIDPRNSKFSVAILAGILVAVILAYPGSALRANDTPDRQIGRFIPLSLPINGRVYERTRKMVARAMERAKQDQARLVLVFEFIVPPGQENFGRGSEYGASYQLAGFLSSEELNGVRTVAYIPQSMEGHAVLVALACQEIVMAKDATIGAAGVDEKTITPTLRSAYAEIASRHRTAPSAIALGLLDPSIEVLQVETETNREFVTPEGLEELAKGRTTKEPVVIKPANEPASFTGTEARRLGIASYLASNRHELAKVLDLPASAVEDDPSLAADWHPIRVDLKGPIRDESVRQVQRVIEEQIRERDVNFVCLWIDSPGGSVDAAMRLANFLAFELDPSKVRTVAYVPREARSDAAIVAFACDQLVMGPTAILGGSGAYEPSPEEVKQVCEVLRKRLAPRKGRSWSLAAAMIDPNLQVFRVTRPGETEFFCRQELNEQIDPAQWQEGPTITTPGESLRLSGVQADEFHLATCLVDSFAQFKKHYQLSNDPTLVEPGWADYLVQALASPGLAVLLLFIGGAALYIELHTPGLGIGGFVAAVCFLLFFWSRYLGGTAGWLEISLFLAGVSCLLLEIFVIPGFGIFGLGGGALVLTSLVLASQTFIWPHNEYQYERLTSTILMLLATGASLLAFGYFARQYLPRAPLLCNMMLAPPSEEEAAVIQRREALVDFHELLGMEGVTTTQLTPGGKARFGDRLIDVMADGEVIARGTQVAVVDVRGSRVLVRQTAENT